VTGELRPHHWSGAHGVPGDTERWEHGSYRWRRLLEAALLVAFTVVIAPKVVSLAEVIGGAALMALGLLWLAVGARPRHLRHPLLDGLIVGGLLGWLVGRCRHR
jgi:hypothetical protein